MKMKFSLAIIIRCICCWVTTTAASAILFDRNLTEVTYRCKMITGQLKCRPDPASYPSLDRDIRLVLDLKDITDLSNVVVNFKYKENVTVLQLNTNKIEILSDFLVQFPNVRILDLSFNRLKSIDRELGQLQKLERVHLQGNPLISISGVAFQGLKNLDHLDISYTNLTELPTNISYGTQLCDNTVVRNATNITNIDKIKFSRDTCIPPTITPPTSTPPKSTPPTSTEQSEINAESKNSIVFVILCGVVVLALVILVVFKLNGRKLRRTITISMKQLQKKQNTEEQNEELSTDDTERPLNQNV